MFKACRARSFKGDEGERRIKVPWCGTNFQEAKELDAHARNHYSKELMA
jgi:hypothetical protein